MPAGATGLLAALAERFRADADALADEMVTRIVREVEELDAFDGPELRETLRASCLANLHAGLGALARDRAVPADVPPDAREFARITARLGVPLAAALRSYRVGHALIWERWLDAVEREVQDGESRRALLATASRYMFDYTDRVSAHVTDLYGAERDAFVRGREQRRTQLVRDVLEGADPDPARALRELDYDLRLEHVACVLAGPDPDGAAAALGAALHAPHRLLVALAGEVAWAWLGRTRPFALPDPLPAPPGAAVTLGEPCAGIEGFRRSHRQARAAHRVRLLTGLPVARYDHVALEALAASDETRMRDFVAHELRGLDGADARCNRLRETLHAYFAAGQNASAAAALLGVHEHTVSYRLRTIEERLGRPVTLRRAELETALRLVLVLEAQAGPPGSSPSAMGGG